MTNRIYRLLYGALLLIGLYFELQWLLYALIIMAILEVITNLRVPEIISKLRGMPGNDPLEGSIGIDFKVRTNFEAERGWRLTVAVMLILSVIVFPDTLWVFSWFMGFAILGAGVSGVCPMYLAMKWIGLR